METIAQYNIMKHINQHFKTGALIIEILGESSIKGTDKTGRVIIFYESGGEIWERGEAAEDD